MIPKILLQSFRKFLERGQVMKRCSRCILQEDFPQIRFDDDGVCNYCYDWDKKWKEFDYVAASEDLKSLFAAASDKKRKYDCMIPFSGGRDSSFVAYLCKIQYGLTPLLVTFNNLFMSEHAIRNISNTVNKLSVDHVMVTYKPKQLLKFYRNMIIGGGEFCSICTSGINHVKIHYQRLFKIPLIINGTSTRVDEQSPFEVTSTHPSYVRKVLSQSGCSQQEINDFLTPRHFELSASDKIKMKLTDSDYIEINLPDYIPWSNQKIQDVLESKLDWQTPDKHADHIDCKFAPVKTFLKNKQIPHFIFKQEKYSQLIRDGQLARREALAKLAQLLATENEDPPELNDFMTFFNLKRHDIENPQKKSHLNYISRDNLAVKEDAVYKILSIPWKIYKRLKTAK